MADDQQDADWSCTCPPTILALREDHGHLIAHLDACLARAVAGDLADQLAAWHTADHAGETLRQRLLRADALVDTAERLLGHIGAEDAALRP